VTRDEILSRFVTERERQFNLPGSEYDMVKTPNDWIAVASFYLSENATRGSHSPVRREDFDDSLAKAAAVILAALEHSEKMQSAGLLS
jgi:hypothetical protein